MMLLYILFMFVLSCNANMDKATKALHKAANRRKDSTWALKAALKKGADINFQHPETKQTPLLTCVFKGKKKCVQYLLKKGADTTIPEQDGYTVMHAAAFQGRPLIAQILIDHGIDPVDFHKDGYAPIHRACWGDRQGHVEVIEVFLKNGVKPDLRTKHGRKPIHLIKKKSPIYEEAAVLFKSYKKKKEL